MIAKSRGKAMAERGRIATETAAEIVAALTGAKVTKADAAKAIAGPRAEGEDIMHLDATFFALVALLIFLGIVIYVGAFRKIGDGLDNRAARIRKELEDAIEPPQGGRDPAHRVQAEAPRSREGSAVDHRRRPRPMPTNMPPRPGASCRNRSSAAPARPSRRSPRPRPPQ